MPQFTPYAHCIINVRRQTLTKHQSMITNGKWILCLFISLLLGQWLCLGESFLFPSDWQKTGPQQATGALHSAHWENGVWVAVGDDGQVLTSGNGLAWQILEGTGSGNLEIVSYGGGQWLAAGPQVMLTSLDGENWQQHANAFHFESIDYGNDIWVGVESGRILYSADGVNWEPAEHPVPDGDEVHFQKVLFGNDGFVVIGSSGAWWSGFRMFMMYSSDGQTWTQTKTSGRFEVAGVDGDFGDGRWVIVAGSGDGRFSARIYETWTSTNGVDWVPVPETGFIKVRHGPDGWLAISYHNQTFIGETRLLWTSPNGVAWTNNHQLWGGCALIDVIGGPETWLELRARRQWTSDNWIHSAGLVGSATLVGLHCDDSIWDEVWYKGGRWIAASQGRIISSADALQWTEASIEMESSFQPLSLAYENGTWLISCIRSDDGAYVYLDSSDTISWRVTKSFTAPEGLPDRFAPLYPRSLIAVDGKFIAYTSRVTSAGQPDGSVILSGQAHILTSSDGVEWDQKSVDALGVRMSYRNGKFIVSGGTSHDIFVSEDAQSWTKVLLDGRGGIFNLEWGRDQWVAVGQSTFTSEDGYQWDKTDIKLPYFGDLMFVDNQWVLVGESGNLAFSKDASEWSIYQSNDSTLQFGKLAFGNGKIVSANRDPYLLVGEIANVEIALPPDIVLRFKRVENILEISWGLENGQIVMESAPTLNGPWWTYKRFRNQETSTQIRLDSTESGRFSPRFFRAKLQ